MKYRAKPTTRFQKDLKRVQKRGYDIDKLKTVIRMLAEGETLASKYKDHPLTGDFSGCRECHIEPDWLLVYEIYEDELILYLTRTGTRSDLF